MKEQVRIRQCKECGGNIAFFLDEQSKKWVAVQIDLIPERQLIKKPNSDIYLFDKNKHIPHRIFCKKKLERKGNPFLNGNKWFLLTYPDGRKSYCRHYDAKELKDFIYKTEKINVVVKEVNKYE